MHVPFCERKCDYCDFYSVTGAPTAIRRAYVAGVLQEAELWAEELGRARFRIRTIFFGGGTPTRLAPEEMQTLLHGLAARLPLETVEEWTVEANPVTVDQAYLRMLRDNGVTRLSIGVQSFDDRDLKCLGRLHDSEGALRTICEARAAGFERLSADLIFGVPEQTLTRWEQNLGQALQLGLTHLSCYGLTYEEATALGRRLRAGEVTPATETEELELFRRTNRILEEGGLLRYEVSNFAAPGEECRHNLLYWKGGNYIGLGPAAASHLSGSRWRTPANLQAWQNAVDGAGLAVEELEVLTQRQRAGELAMLMLRTARGMDCQTFRSRLTIDPMSLFHEQIRKFVKNGLLEVSSGGARLTQRGLEVADAVSAEFLT